MRHPLLAVVLVAVAVAPRPVVAAERAARTDPAGSRTRAAAPVRDPAAVLSDLQQWLGVMSGALEPTPESTRGLEVALRAAKGRAIDAAVVRELAAGLAHALVGVELDEESLERLAQNLFAAMNSRDLSGREVGLLLVDIMTLLGAAGAEPPAIDRVTRHLIAACPAVPEGLPLSRDTAGPAVLTRR